MSVCTYTPRACTALHATAQQGFKVSKLSKVSKVSKTSQTPKLSSLQSKAQHLPAARVRPPRGPLRLSAELRGAEPLARRSVCLSASFGQSTECLQQPRSAAQGRELRELACDIAICCIIATLLLCFATAAGLPSFQAAERRRPTSDFRVPVVNVRPSIPMHAGGRAQGHTRRRAPDLRRSPVAHGVAD
ncbi:hypothetical protein BC628DRAFT_1366333 [Trametes gibbosa]|nr:hypothetical protein BC628DRAFT_1366333 [Trametes gibbosa]